MISRSGAWSTRRPPSAPARWSIDGRHARIETLDADRHGDALWQAVRDDDSLWTYMGYGPFAGPQAPSTPGSRPAPRPPMPLPMPCLTATAAAPSAASRSWRSARRCASSRWATSSTRRALQRTPAATEAQYLFARYVFEDLGYRRYEWKCNDLNAPSRRAALAPGVYLRGHLPAAYDRQGPEPRHGVVRDARFRLAGTEGCIRTVARSFQFRRRRAPAGEPCRDAGAVLSVARAARASSRSPCWRGWRRRRSLPPDRIGSPPTRTSCSPTRTSSRASTAAISFWSTTTARAISTIATRSSSRR